MNQRVNDSWFGNKQVEVGPRGVDPLFLSAYRCRRPTRPTRTRRRRRTRSSVRRTMTLAAQTPPPPPPIASVQGRAPSRSVGHHRFALVEAVLPSTVASLSLPASLLAIIILGVGKKEEEEEVIGRSVRLRSVAHVRFITGSKTPLKQSKNQSKVSQ